MCPRPARRAALGSPWCTELSPRLLPSLAVVAPPVETVRELGSVSGGAAVSGVEAVAHIGAGKAVTFRFHLDHGGPYLLLVRHDGIGLGLVAHTPEGDAPLPVDAPGPFQTIPLDLDAADYAVTASASQVGDVFVDWELLLNRAVGLSTLGGPVGGVPVPLPASASTNPVAATAPASAGAPSAFLAVPALAPRGLAEPNEAILPTPRMIRTNRPEAEAEGAGGDELRAGPNKPTGPVGLGPAAGDPPRSTLVAATLGEAAQVQPTASLGPALIANASSPASADEFDARRDGGALAQLDRVPPWDEAALGNWVGRATRRGGLTGTAGQVGAGVAVGAVAVGALLLRHRRRAAVVSLAAGQPGEHHHRTGPYAPRSLLRSILGYVE